MYSTADLSIGKGPYSCQNLGDLEGYTRSQHGHTLSLFEIEACCYM